MRVAVILGPVLIRMTIRAIVMSGTVTPVRTAPAIRGRIVVIIMMSSQSRQSIRSDRLIVAAVMVIMIINLGRISVIRLFVCSPMLKVVTLHRRAGSGTRYAARVAFLSTVLV